ncbi:ectonucleotide pyrophosphatase/phosphodiesterase [Mucilaginibacter sp. dw_454]|uniref:alkaline phosphatase family protein n=1 Tax=Mucilaginibacter sp. dw_454 TaxID=2720079 RepID=UPI001BD1EA96|nr:ectonucleotide pyrophosphatase/phosphodiesterase [Mucilaginibacter sp. dw_454]
MRKLICSSILCCCLLFSVKAQQAKHVILISIDGFHPDMYLDKSWPMPNLRALMKAGTYADHLLSVFPSYTYSSHVAMVTGALPARSGTYFNQPKNSKGEWNWFNKDIKVPTIWQVLKKAGMTTASVEWPPSVTSDITWDLPEIWAIDQPYDRITEARKYATPGLVSEIEQNATGKLDSNTMNAAYFSLDENAGRAAAYIFKAHRPAFLAVHLAEVDETGHDYGRDADSVRLAAASVDRAIGDILETVQRSNMKDSTAIIIVGDHGFSTIHTVFRPNMLIKNVPAKFTAAGGSAFLYASQPGTRANRDIIKAVTDSLNQLPKDKRQLFRIIDRKELDQMGADSSALMALTGFSGTVFSGAMAKAKITDHGPGTLIQQNPLEGVFIPAHGGHHGFDPRQLDMYTGFIAAGAGINKGKEIPELTVTDIAPIIAQLLGVEFKTPDGKLPQGLIKN